MKKKKIRFFFKDQYDYDNNLPTVEFEATDGELREHTFACGKHVRDRDKEIIKACEIALTDGTADIGSMEPDSNGYFEIVND